ncbi:ANTAR domain-containing protein [Actinomadura fulvescens]|uniref:ANTAR domain-containing protein n=1 Tax=Actinomadura fulvescens TaxID=46160 RepID=UPI0031D5215E
MDEFDIAGDDGLPDVVHQAAGMVSVQLGVKVADAYARLLGYAQQCGRPVEDVADDVVERQLHLDGPMPEPERTDAPGGAANDGDDAVPAR